MTSEFPFATAMALMKCSESGPAGALIADHVGTAAFPVVLRQRVGAPASNFFGRIRMKTNGATKLALYSAASVIPELMKEEEFPPSELRWIWRKLYSP